MTRMHARCVFTGKHARWIKDFSQGGERGPTLEYQLPDVQGGVKKHEVTHVQASFGLFEVSSSYQYYSACNYVVADVFSLWHERAFV